MKHTNKLNFAPPPSSLSNFIICAPPPEDFREHFCVAGVASGRSCSASCCLRVQLQRRLLGRVLPGGRDRIDRTAFAGQSQHAAADRRSARDRHHFRLPRSKTSTDAPRCQGAATPRCKPCWVSDDRLVK